MTAVAVGTAVPDVITQTMAVLRTAERKARRRDRVTRALLGMCQFGFVLDAGVASVLLADHGYLADQRSLQEETS